MSYHVRVTLSALLSAIIWSAAVCPAVAGDRDATVVFDAVPVRFAPDGHELDSHTLTALDNGRAVRTTVHVPEIEGPVRITAHVIIEPVPRDDRSVHDKWDRAGNIRVVRADQPDLELVKFVTAYGGRTEYSVDVTDLAPALAGPTTFLAFIDTWVAPAWHVSLSLHFVPDTTAVKPAWVQSVIFEPSYTHEGAGDAGIEAGVTVPQGLERVYLQYLVSGHCTDGRGADEFVAKDHVIRVDDAVVYRYRPWRDDCGNYRAINPYCKKWSDGYWSSDFSRSGWCPGDVVKPLELDLTDHFAAGEHTIRFTVEDVRPKNADDHYGYWRISARLIGWTNVPLGTP